jgi:hypothetical protein
MSVTTSYEIYRKRGNDWVVVSVCADRDRALAQARRLGDEAPRTEVRVIEERFDPLANATSTSILLHRNLPERQPPPDQVPRRPRKRAAPQPPAPDPMSALVRTLVFLTLGLGGVSAAAVLGLAFAADFLK